MNLLTQQQTPSAERRSATTRPQADHPPATPIGQLAKSLALDENGIWHSKGAAEVSHPELWQDRYLQVENTSFWFAHRARCINACAGRFPLGGTIFDVGGGNGHVTASLIAAGHQAVLIEPSLAAAQNARRRGVETVVCSTLETAGITAESIPAIGLFDVLEHIEDDRAFLQMLSRHLRPGGRLYLTVPAYRLLWSRQDELVGHYRRYRLGQLERLLASTGFAVEQSTYLFAFLVPAILLLRTIPYRLGLARADRSETFTREHNAQRPLIGKFIGRLLDWECASVRGGRRIPCGSSCLVVARRL